MKSVTAWFVEGNLPRKSEATEEAAKQLAAVKIRRVDLKPVDPFVDNFGGFQDEAGQKVGGFLYFSEDDAKEVVRRAAAPILRRIDAEREALKELV